MSDAAPSRVAVIADVHGNAQACREALRMVRRRGFDRLIILGDLLTYGCEPTAVLHLVGEAVERDDAVVVAGNHDQLYIDLARGFLGYYRTLPSWLREAVDWTAGAVAGTDLACMLPWVEQHETGEMLLAHANPFGYGNWTYLNGPADLTRAAQTLRERGKRVGVFGHTHRAKIALVAADGRTRVDVPAEGDRRKLILLDMAEHNIVVVDPGSVGQPRDQAKASTVLFLSPSTASLELEHARVPYDIEAHKRAIMAATLSSATRAKLLGYLP